MLPETNLFFFWPNAMRSWPVHLTMACLWGIGLYNVLLLTWVDQFYFPTNLPPKRVPYPWSTYLIVIDLHVYLIVNGL